MSARAAVGDTFASFRRRGFRLFFAGQSISQVGNWLTLVAQTLLVLRLTGSGVALGLLAACQFGPVLVLGPFAGVVADRSDKRRLLLRVQSLAMLQSFALAALVAGGDPPVIAVYAVALAGGFCTAFDNPVRRSFVVELVPEDEVPNAVSLNSALMTGARVVGPALAGALVSTVGFVWCFLVDGLSYIAVLAFVSRIRRDDVRPAETTPRGRGQVREGFRYARSTPALWTPLVMMAVVGTLAFNFQTVLPLFATRDLGGTVVTFTLLMSVLSVGSFVGALLTARRRSVGIRTVGIAALQFGIAMCALAVAPGQPLAFAVAAVMGLSSISFMTASTAIVQTQAAPSMRGRVLALQAMVFLGSTPIGGPLVGIVSETFGARHALALGGVATIGAGAAGLAQARRHEPAVEDGVS